MNSPGKLKVAWICHFSNPEIRARLPLGKTLKSRIRQAMHKGKFDDGLFDFAPWITNLTEAFESVKEIDLHVISPHRNLARLARSFSMNNIGYHFFKPDNDFLLFRLIRIAFRVKAPRYLLNRLLIKTMLKDIKPDLIVLIGSENPYYSIAALDIKERPMMLFCQTVYTNPDRKRLSGQADEYRWELELKIHKKTRYYGSGSRMHRDLVLVNNPEAEVFRMHFPEKRPKKSKDATKKYDFVFFAAGVAEKKGIEDAIKALAIVKKTKQDVALDVVGKCSHEYRERLDNLIKENALEDNIVFHGYFPQLADMHRHIQEARYALLPVKLDAVPGAIREAMLLDLPIITYKTSGTPHLNKYGEAVLLCEIGDIDALARNMIRILNEPDLALRLLQNAGKYVDIEFDNKKNTADLIKMFYAVHAHYYQGTPLPGALLFDPQEYAVY